MHLEDQAESDGSFASDARGRLKVGEQLRFEMVRIHRHLAPGNLLLGCAPVAEFTNSQAAFRAHRRAEDPASHGTSLVKIAGTLLRVENRANLVVGECFEPLFRFGPLVQNSGARVARKPGGQPCDRIPSPGAYPGRSLRISALQLGQSAAQAPHIELMDRKYSNTTLAAAGPADQPCAAFSGCFRKSCVGNLDQLLIACAKLFGDKHQINWNIHSGCARNRTAHTNGATEARDPMKIR